MIPACRAGCSGSNPDRGVLIIGSIPDSIAGPYHDVKRTTYLLGVVVGEEDDSSRKSAAWARRSFAFCSAVFTASAPATHRRGGGDWRAICTRPAASLAGSPTC